MELDPKDVLGILLDHYSSQIIMGTMERARGIRELSKEYNIPLSVCYRRVKMLASMGILSEQRVGNRVKYISNIDSFNAILDFERNSMRVEMTADGEEFKTEGNIV